MKFVLETTDLGVGDEMFQNDPKDQHGPPEMYQESWRQRLGYYQQGLLGTDRAFILQNKPVIKPAFGELALWFHLKYLLQKRRNCPLFLGSKS